VGTAAQSSQSSWILRMDGTGPVDSCGGHQQTSHSGTGCGSSSSFQYNRRFKARKGKVFTQGHYRILDFRNLHVVCGSGSSYHGLALCPAPAIAPSIWRSAEFATFYICQLDLSASHLRRTTTSIPYQFLHLPLPPSVRRSDSSLPWMCVDQVEKDQAISCKPFAQVRWWWCGAVQHGLSHGSCSNSYVQRTRGLLFLFFKVLPTHYPGAFYLFVAWKHFALLDRLLYKWPRAYLKGI